LDGEIIEASEKSMKKIKICDKFVGECGSVFIIAEAGVNHNGNVELAKKMIDVAKSAGVDAVKFQLFRAESLVTKNAKKAAYQQEFDALDETQFEMLKKLELSKESFIQLADYCRKKDIIFLASPFDAKSVDLLTMLDTPVFKLASGEITNLPLLEYIAEKKRPIILSTGMAEIEEVKQAIDVIHAKGNKDIILLHCVTDYPTRPEDVNLKVILTLHSMFGLPIGFSDHTLGIAVSIAAVGLGAKVIEKHFTLDRSMPGPDHKASLNPAELAALVKAIRDVEKALGDGVKKITANEEKNRALVRKSIVASIDIPEGTVIKSSMFSLKRPGSGIQPMYLHAIVGRRVNRNISKDDILTWEMLS
jgi:N,N'-diacetyllegionaminate synthase